MRIALSDIHEEGLELSYGETPQDLDLVYPDIGFDGGIRTQVRLMRVMETVTATGAVDACLILGCGRCARPFPYLLHLPFHADFNPRGSKEVSGENRRLLSGDLDLYFYTGQILDLGEFVREQILLVVPMVPLCRVDCLGLCPQCGQDRNIRDCGCVTVSKDPKR